VKPTSKRRRLRAALLRRARVVIGTDASPLDYVERYVANRGRFSDLARSLQEEMGESLSRGFLSFIARRLEPDARARIDSARAVAEYSKPSVACSRKRDSHREPDRNLSV
jgi:hypothetical protein